MSGAPKKSETVQREEKTLAFWKRERIFEKSVEKDAPRGEYVFYDGPPFATGLPHHGSLLSSVIKDVVPRYKTMRGYRVRRQWGWDCHGLPIENLVEKKLNLKTKKDIEKIGIARFNSEARSLVLQFADDWEKYIDRVGRWVDFRNDYKTMDTSYIESVWWGLSEMHKKGLLYEGKRVLMYCPHCETPLAKAEIAADNTYKDITEEAVTVKFKVTNPKAHDLPENTYLLAWTTTPWTLPGNVALAVGKDVEYTLINVDKESVIVSNQARARLGLPYEGPEISPTGKSLSGNELLGVEYEPLFDVPALRSDTSFKVYAADFVSTEEGTGIVHTAVMYGEDDFALGQKEGLPMVQMLTPSATYNDIVPEFLRGKYIKDAERDIKRDLEGRGLLFARANHTHSYPHCWRCGTPLIYNAVPSWFVNIQKIKGRMLAENERIQWVPEHLKHGRFKNIVEGAPDWTISRNRYWASPLPIWKDSKGSVHVIGSVNELLKRTKSSGNRYRIMRHGEAKSNVENFLDSGTVPDNHLTERGREQVIAAANTLAGKGIDLIIASPLLRTQETAKLVAKKIGLTEESIVIDERLAEVSFGEYSGKSREEWIALFSSYFERLHKKVDGAETMSDVRRRVGTFIFDIDRRYNGKSILIVTHAEPGWVLEQVAACKSCAVTAPHTKPYREQEAYLGNAGVREFSFTPYPHDAAFELDLHRPYIDEVVLVDEHGRELTRIPEVVDCWVESGSMPFASKHYVGNPLPEFDPRNGFLRRPRGYPADFIAEYIAQTRTWFYYMHAVAVALFNRRSFSTVVSTGNVLAADGAKISKSKGNYTDPLLLLDQYGADAYRFYLMNSVVMQSEDTLFRDEEVRDTHNRVIGILWNSYKFFELYKSELDSSIQPRQSKNVLDRWAIARLDEVTREATDALDSYDMPRACRAFRGFVDDYSTWYVRRSRARVKSADARDKAQTLAVQRFALEVFAQLIAPVMPFVAEALYQGVGGVGQSVHLTAWPQAPTPDSAVLNAMKTVRDVVSRGLEARARARLKVRQPLQTLTVHGAVLPKEYLELVKDEVNVKNVVCEAGKELSVTLDTTLTDALRAEGDARELIRAIQDARKEGGLTVADTAHVTMHAPPEVWEVLAPYHAEIERLTHTKLIWEDSPRAGGTTVTLSGGVAHLTLTRDG